MANKCGNCGSEFPTKDKLIAHMATVHDSFFEEGDEKMVAYSQKLKEHPAVQIMKAINSGDIEQATTALNNMKVK